MIRLNLSICAALLGLGCSLAVAQSDSKPVKAKGSPVKLAAPEPVAEESGKGSSSAVDSSVTEHTAQIAGKTIHYTVTAASMPLLGDDGKKKADVFYIAYNVQAADGKPRPITFCFNGGPGSSSVWLHMGMLGPKRVKLASDAEFTPPPAEVVPNPYSLLDVTDLVFIDPVGTGFSRPAEGEKKEQFHGFQEDLQSVGKFIARYVTEQGRWGSPKFLCGESYGTLRASALAQHLQDEHYLELNGIILVSTVLDFQTIAFGGRNDLPYVLFLPSYTATAWYHKQLGDDLQGLSLEKVVAEARSFAEGEYLQALLKGNRLSKGERRKIATELARLTGLPRKFIEQSDLRVSMGRFSEQLLKESDKIVGRFDSRYTGRDADAAGANAECDPSASALFGAFTSAVNQYFSNELQVSRKFPYEILTGKVHPWNYSQFTNKYVDVTEMLGEAMAQNPALRVFVANGYYDLATPFAAAEYTMAHLQPNPAKSAVVLKYYPGGHMMYVHEPSLEQLRTDLVEFYEQTLKSPGEKAPEGKPESNPEGKQPAAKKAGQPAK